MKVVVTNAVVSNTGDAAIFEGIQTALIDAGVAAENITLLDSNAARTRKLYPTWRILQQSTTAIPRRIVRLRPAIARVKGRIVRALAQGSAAPRWLLHLPLMRSTNFARALRAIEESDVLVSTGGTYLVDNYDFSARVLELQYAHRLGKKIVLWTQSLGPFATPQSVRRIRPIIECDPQTNLRDQESLESWVRAGGDRKRATVVPDAVFGLTAPTGSALADRSRMLISVRRWSHAGPTGEPFDEAQYRDAMRAAAVLGRARALDVSAMSTCQGVDNYLDDSEYAAIVFADSDVQVNTDFHTPTELLREIARSQVVVTTRMHLAILALISGVPAIAIAYEFKTLALFESLGLGRFAVPIEKVDGEWVQRALEDVFNAPDDAVLSLEQRAELRRAAFAPAYRAISEA